MPLLLLANNLNSEVAGQPTTVVLATEMRQVISIAINISATLSMSMHIQRACNNYGGHFQALKFTNEHRLP